METRDSFSTHLLCYLNLLSLVILGLGWFKRQYVKLASFELTMNVRKEGETFYISGKSKCSWYYLMYISLLINFFCNFSNKRAEKTVMNSSGRFVGGPLGGLLGICWGVRWRSVGGSVGGSTHCSRVTRYPSFIAQDFFHFSTLIHNGDNLNM